MIPRNVVVGFNCLFILNEAAPKYNKEKVD